MAFGPACERCRACSYEGSTDKHPIRCPFCGKPKRRGSREELVSVLNEALHTLYAAAGYIGGVSICSEEQIKARIRETVEKINDI